MDLTLGNPGWRAEGARGRGSNAERVRTKPVVLILWAGPPDWRKGGSQTLSGGFSTLGLISIISSYPEPS